MGVITQRPERLLFAVRPGVTDLRQGSNKNVVNCGNQIYPDHAVARLVRFNDISNLPKTM